MGKCKPGRAPHEASAGVAHHEGPWNVPRRPENGLNFRSWVEPRNSGRAATFVATNVLPFVARRLRETEGDRILPGRGADSAASILGRRYAHRTGTPAIA